MSFQKKQFKIAHIYSPAPSEAKFILAMVVGVTPMNPKDRNI